MNSVIEQHIEEISKKPVIFINFDFTTGRELSYVEGKECKVSFETNCTTFFNTDNNAIVRKKDGSEISVVSLLSNHGFYTEKEIRPEHNLYKMLLADAFTFVKPKEPIDFCKVTDYEKLKNLFTEFGLGFEELSGHAVSGAISDLNDSNTGNKAIACTMGEHLKVGGYTGFSSEFVFDKDGKFIQLNCWE